MFNQQLSIGSERVSVGADGQILEELSAETIERALSLPGVFRQVKDEQETLTAPAPKATVAVGSPVANDVEEPAAALAPAGMPKPAQAPTPSAPGMGIKSKTFPKKK